MLKTLASFISILIIAVGFCQKPAYKIYTGKGKEVSYQKMLKHIEKQDILLFGELHNNAIAHWLQYEVTADLNKKRKLILGAEMFEADNQIALNDYLKDSITAKGLDTLARLWPNHKTDYAPLLDFAKDHNLPFIATNIPRRFASLVYINDFAGLDSLTDIEKSWIAPLPIPFDSELPTYKHILEMMGKHGSPKLVKAQAIKDATMAYFIAKNHIEGSLSIHYNGAYHSDNYEGILWYLRKESTTREYCTISTVTQKDINKLKEESYGVADFIICVDENMTNTY